jgi:hypothetical protein
MVRVGFITECRDYNIVFAIVMHPCETIIAAYIMLLVTLNVVINCCLPKSIGNSHLKVITQILSHLRSVILFRCSYDQKTVNVDLRVL